MSDPYTYFTQPGAPTFPGEVPLPGSVGDADVGFSSLKANADHSHDFAMGAEASEWQNVLFVSPWTNLGGTARTCQYTRIGGVGFLRGVATYPGGIPAGSTNQIMFSISPNYTPLNGERELIVCLSNLGALEMDLQADGNVRVASYAGATYHFWGTAMWSID
jgi:hypothetical protein